jgi:hypothetical protein
MYASKQHAFMMKQILPSCRLVFPEYKDKWPHFISGSNQVPVFVMNGVVLGALSSQNCGFSRCGVARKSRGRLARDFACVHFSVRLPSSS